MRLDVSAAAEADLAAIAEYVAADSPAAALRLLQKLRQKLSALAGAPGIGRARPELGADLRSLAVGSYLVFYRERPDRVEIVRILHGARDLGPLLE